MLYYNIYYIHCMHVCSVMSNSVTPWIEACQAPLCPWDFPGKNTGKLPFPLPRDLFNSEMEPIFPVSLALTCVFFTTEPPGKPLSLK